MWRAQNSKCQRWARVICKSRFQIFWQFMTIHGWNLFVYAGSEEDGKESKSEVSGYLVGFAKRVVLCTILVFAFKWVLEQDKDKGYLVGFYRICFVFSLQECLAPSSKPLLARASGKGLVCREVARKCCWNEFIFMLHVSPIAETIYCFSNW